MSTYNAPITISEAIKYALSVQQKYPSMFVCGSLCLNLFGILDNATVNDVDFITTDFKLFDSFAATLNDNEYYLDDDKHKIIDLLGIQCCLFTPMMSDNIKNITHIPTGVKCGHPNEVLYQMLKLKRDTNAKLFHSLAFESAERSYET